MIQENFIQKGLFLQNLPIYSEDIMYIQDILTTMRISKQSFTAFPYLHELPPVTVVEKELFIR